MPSKSADARRTRISKTLSFWLRHNPAAGGLTLDACGWADADAVLRSLNSQLQPAVTEDELRAVVAQNEKQRFRLDGGRIRANQGHSIAVTPDIRPVEPPCTLYHGTTRERWERIRASGGLSKMRRHHVHLSPDIEAARRVGGRHRGERPLVLRVDAAAMRAAGHAFFVSENGVYLTDAVPLGFLAEERD